MYTDAHLVGGFSHVGDTFRDLSGSFGYLLHLRQATMLGPAENSVPGMVATSDGHFAF